MKIWVTKYALTKGIIEVAGELSAHSNHMMWRYGYLASKEYAKTYEEAVAKAHEMATKKIASLERQLAKVKELEATWADELKGGVQ